MLIFAVLFSSGAFVAGKLALKEIPPLTLAAGRFIVASVLLWAWTRKRTSARRRLSAADLPLIAGMGMTAIAGYNILFLFGLTMAPASDAAIITPGLAPALTALLARLILREQVSGWMIGGLGTGLLGLILVVNPGGGDAGARALGDLLFFLGAACWAVYSLLGKTATKRFTPVGATLYGTVTGTLILLPFALVERGWTSLLASPPVAWLSLLYMGVFATALSFVFFYEGVSRIGPVRAATFAFLVPVFGVISSVIILGERLTAATVAGGILVLFGLWLVQRPVAAPARELDVAALTPDE